MIVGATLAMDDVGFIVGSYALTFAAIGMFTWRVLRGGRKLADQIDDEHKYWT